MSAVLTSHAASSYSAERVSNQEHWMVGEDASGNCVTLIHLGVGFASPLCTCVPLPATVTSETACRKFEWLLQVDALMENLQRHGCAVLVHWSVLLVACLKTDRHRRYQTMECDRQAFRPIIAWRSAVRRDRLCTCNAKEIV